MTPGCEKLNIEPVEKREEMNLSKESGLKSEETSLLPRAMKRPGI